MANEPEHKMLFDVRGRRKRVIQVIYVILAVIMAAVILGSCYMLVQSNLKPFIGEFPLNSLLGLIGLGVAFFYGFVLFIGFLRSGGV